MLLEFTVVAGGDADAETEMKRKLEKVRSRRSLDARISLRGWKYSKHFGLFLLPASTTTYKYT
jgi:hypothetical protein